MGALMVGFSHRSVVLFLFDLKLLLGLLSHGVEAASALILKLLVQISSFELVLHPLLNDLFKGFSAGDVGEHNFLFVGFDVCLILDATLIVYFPLSLHHLVHSLFIEHPIN